MKITLQECDMGKQNNKKTGARGENEAAELLQRKGYRLLRRNFRSKWGEIDLITKLNNLVVFVEVKTKTGRDYGEPWEMINGRKIAQIERIGEMWCRENDWNGVCRIDAVGVWMNPLGEVVKIEHWENIQI